jgi:anti-anti-sigma factor
VAYAGRMQPPRGREFGWDGHLLLLYATEQQRRAGVTAWVRRGLETAAKIVYVESPDEPVERSLFRVLLEEHAELRHAVDRGQLQIVGPDVGLGAEWHTHVVQEGLAAGYPAVRLGGEAGTFWTMSAPDHADAERAADQLCGVLPASILCQYATSLPALMLERACSTHADGVREAKLQIVLIWAGVAVSGEVDGSNVHILRSALAAACIRAVRRETFVVDLAGLDFLDVAGARTLVTGTALLRGRGVAVRVRAATPQVDRLLRQLGVAGIDGLVLEDPS